MTPVYIYLTAIVIILLTILYKYSTRNFEYWKKRKVHGPNPTPLLGNIGNIFVLRESLGSFFGNLYNSSEEPILGFYILDEPCVFIRSPEIAKQILVRDFNQFKDRTITAPKHDEIFANAIFVQKSPDWRTTRAKLTPVFTTGKMKSMFPQIKEIGQELIAFLKANLGQHNAKDICDNYTIDVTVKCFFGVNANSFKKNAELKIVGKAMFDFSLRNAVMQSMYFFKSGIVNMLRLSFFSSEMQNYFVDMFLSTIKKREELNYSTKDFISTLTDITKEDPTFGKCYNQKYK